MAEAEVVMRIDERDWVQLWCDVTSRCRASARSDAPQMGSVPPDPQRDGRRVKMASVLKMNGRIRRGIRRFMRWLTKLLPSSPPPLPVLLRIDASAGPPEVVEIEAIWSPSGRRTRRQLRTAAGLCVMPWMANERAVELDVRTASGQTRLELERDRSDGGRVHDLSFR